MDIVVTALIEPASSLESFRALLLDKAFRPLRAVGWRRALCLDLCERVEVLEYYDRRVRTTGASFPLPAVIRVPGWLHRLPQIVPPTRRNVLLRDGFACRYCGWEGTSAQLTIDHVLPRSRGGRTSWENVVAACAPCNRRKGDRTPAEANMPLDPPPRAPSALQLGRRGMVMGDAPAEWEPYL
ncbi:MAG: HNH endonuclease [Myxococcales bacterium]|nr:HNH endonuclease [Myxococcales bacterium]